MADSVYTPALLKRTKTSAELVGIFSLTFSNADYVTGGVLPALTFSQIAGFTNRKPDWVTIQGISGYIYEYVYASAKIKIRQDGGTSGAAAPLVEVPVAPVPVLEDTIRVRVGYFTTPALMAI